MPQLVRLYIRQCLAGFAAGILFAMALVATDTAHLGHLVGTVDGGWLGFALLALFNGLVFAGAFFAGSILAMGAGREDE